MAGFTYDNLVTDIRNYTEVDSNVLTAAICNRIIEDAEFKILRDVPLDAYKKHLQVNLNIMLCLEELQELVIQHLEDCF